MPHFPASGRTYNFAARPLAAPSGVGVAAPLCLLAASPRASSGRLPSGPTWRTRNFSQYRVADTESASKEDRKSGRPPLDPTQGYTPAACLARFTPGVDLYEFCSEGLPFIHFQLIPFMLGFVPTIATLPPDSLKFLVREFFLDVLDNSLERPSRTGRRAGF